MKHMPAFGLAAKWLFSLIILSFSCESIVAATLKTPDYQVLKTVDARINAVKLFVSHESDQLWGDDQSLHNYYSKHRKRYHVPVVSRRKIASVRTDVYQLIKHSTNQFSRLYQSNGRNPYAALAALEPDERALISEVNDSVLRLKAVADRNAKINRRTEKWLKDGAKGNVSQTWPLSVYTDSKQTNSVNLEKDYRLDKYSPTMIITASLLNESGVADSLLKKEEKLYKANNKKLFAELKTASNGRKRHRLFEETSAVQTVNRSQEQGKTDAEDIEKGSLIGSTFTDVMELAQSGISSLSVVAAQTRDAITETLGTSVVEVTRTDQYGFQTWPGSAATSTSVDYPSTKPQAPKAVTDVFPLLQNTSSHNATDRANHSVFEAVTVPASLTLSEVKKPAESHRNAGQASIQRFADPANSGNGTATDDTLFADALRVLELDGSETYNDVRKKHREKIQQLYREHQGADHETQNKLNDELVRLNGAKDTLKDTLTGNEPADTDSGTTESELGQPGSQLKLADKTSRLQSSSDIETAYGRSDPWSGSVPVRQWFARNADQPGYDQHVTPRVDHEQLFDGAFVSRRE